MSHSRIGRQYSKMSLPTEFFCPPRQAYPRCIEEKVKGPEELQLFGESRIQREGVKT